MNFTKFSLSFKMSMKSILGNKGRSALTMLGIIIGVSSVILLTGIGAGTTKSITDSISSMGTNKITVALSRNMNSSRTITIKDMQKYLTDHPKEVTMMSPYLNGSVTVKNGTVNATTKIDGCDVDYQTISDLELSAGRFFDSTEVDSRKKVCVIGTYVEQNLFNGANAVGKQVKINGTVFQVVGVYKETDSSQQNGGDDKITIPYTTAIRFLKNAKITTFYFYALDKETVQNATNNLKTYITKKLGTDTGFNVSNLTTLLDKVTEMTGIMTIMLAGIAGISLVVGGIGIMNIMTVSVSERTREIGIRKAIGARTTDILMQFLIEAVVLSGLGGFVGVVFGIILGQVFDKIIKITFVTQWNMVLMSFIFSLVVGVFFGLAPAKKAAKLNPIDALRSE